MVIAADVVASNAVPIGGALAVSVATESESDAIGEPGEQFLHGTIAAERFP